MLHERDLLGVDLSPENAELLDALGVLPPDRAERLLTASEHDERPAEWSADLVKRRLREATGHIESVSPDKRT
jgi:hypothetical protein